MADPNKAATDPRAAAKQEQVKRDTEALRDSARRNENTSEQAETDPRAAELQERVHRDHDRLEESARRVESSVPADVRNTPVDRRK